MGEVAGRQTASTTYGNETVMDWGADYQAGNWNTFGMISKVFYSQSTKPSATTYEIGTTYTPTPKWQFGVGAQLQRRNNDVKSAHQFTLSASRVFYRRGSASAEIYAVFAALHDAGWPAYVISSSSYASGGSEQTAVRTGVRLRF